MAEPNLNPPSLHIGEEDGPSCEECRHYESPERDDEIGFCLAYGTLVAPQWLCDSYTDPASAQ